MLVFAERIIAEYLKSVSAGTDPAQNGTWPIFTGQIPDNPDSCIAVHRDSYPTQGREHRTGKTVHHDGLQIRIRSKKYSDGETKLQEIFAICDAVRRNVIAVGIKRYNIQSITQLTTPAFIGPDPSNRLNFVLNCVVSVDEIS